MIIVALVQTILIVAAFGLCGYLFVSLKREIHLVEAQSRRETAETGKLMESLKGEIADLKKELESMPPMAASLPAVATGINLNKRTQAMRMMKLGEGPEHIAAALSMPRKEVELLVKVQRMLIDGSAITS